MQDTNIISVKDVVNKLIGTSPFKHKIAAASMRCIWQKVMPPAVCSRTDSLFIRENKVFVKVSSAPLRQELQSSKIKVLSLLQKGANSYKINDVVFL